MDLHQGSQVPAVLGVQVGYTFQTALGAQVVFVPHTPLPQVPSIIPTVMIPKLKMPTTSFPTFDGTGHVHEFLEKFYNYGNTHGLVEQQIILLLFTYLKGTAVEWYAAVVGKTPPTEWDQEVTSFGRQIRVAPSSCEQLSCYILYRWGKGSE